MSMEEKRIAMLIDGENISSKFIEGILDEASKHGAVTYKRIYGNWESIVERKWEEKIRENSITPMMQINNTAGKNASDSALIIDAMDILYTNVVEGFCIVTSDGDFTRLAGRLREAGKMVIGMGEEKTPKSFRAACSIFTNLNVLLDSREEETELSREIVESSIVDIINQNLNAGRVTGLGEVGSRLINKFPDFDVRNYGYSLLSKFIEEMETINLEMEKGGYVVYIEDNVKAKKDITDYLIALLEERPMGLSELSNKIYQYDGSFKVKDYGYSSFSKFLQKIPNVEIRGNRTKKVYLNK